MRPMINPQRTNRRIPRDRTSKPQARVGCIPILTYAEERVNSPIDPITTAPKSRRTDGTSRDARARKLRVGVSARRGVPPPARHADTDLENESDHPLRSLRVAPQAPLSARDGLFAGQHLLNQRSEDGLVHRCESDQTCVQTLKLCPRHGVEIHARSRLWRTHPLQPPEQDLRCAGIRDGALSQATLDSRVSRGSLLRRVARLRDHDWYRRTSRRVRGHPQLLRPRLYSGQAVSL
jgi:hypothetical protein